MKSIQSFEGIWRLRSFEQRTPGGIVYPYGRAATGLISYSDLGLMSVQIMSERLTAPPGPGFNPDDEPLFEAEPATDHLPALVEVYDSYLAYFGRYSIDWSARTVAHYVEGSNRPGFLHRRLVRAFEFDGGILRLSPPSSEASPTTLVWERLGG